MRPRLLPLLRWTLLARTAVGTVGARAAIRPSILALAVALLLTIALLAVAPAFETTLLLAIATIAITAPVTTAAAITATAAITTAAAIAALVVAARIALRRRRLSRRHRRGLHRSRHWRGRLEYREHAREETGAGACCRRRRCHGLHDGLQCGCGLLLRRARLRARRPRLRFVDDRRRL